jgi:glycosyltransferase involved in cell wall biosynthesis
MSTVLVVTASYNTPRAWLLQAAASIAAQDYPHRHAIVDDGSDREETLTALAELGDRVTRYPHGGPGTGILNRAIEGEPRSDYIAVLDHDDVALPGRLRTEAAYLDAHPGVALVSGYGQVIDRDGVGLDTWKYGGPYEAVRRLPRKKNGTLRPPFHSSVMYRREWWQKVGGYPHDFPADALFFAALERAGARFTCLPLALAQKRVWEGSLWENRKKRRLLAGAG